ncbi:Hypothetical predicted protein [Marmota monax]|uniref:Uncharacterized protein n=1 Tax=Marmota monax TaxID=9995 RepID=A0A5E4B691_MARMO|nr:hypothetical protein GHT09_010895 [Marmota monax]VTJ65237.1 Hypothetical predicted protein [Marmota monax]
MTAQSREVQGEGLRLGLGLPEVATSVLEFQEPTDNAEAAHVSVEQTEEVAEEEQADEMIDQVTEIRVAASGDGVLAEGSGEIPGPWVREVVGPDLLQIKAECAG